MKKLNPFADYGGIVKNDRFVGRKKLIETIQGRLLGMDSFGNLAIMGLPRIGKSSLAWNALMIDKEKLIVNKIIPIWISFGEYENLFECFDEIFFSISESLKPRAKGLKKLEELRKLFLEKSNTSLEKRRYIKKYLSFFKMNEYRLVLILDEFDHAKNILSLQDFQFLREISYNPETKIGIVTTSRKSIQEIEPDEGVLSNFYQIFTDINLQLFNSEDITSYWARLNSFGLNVNDVYKNNVYDFVGYHPFLLDILNNEIFINTVSSTVDLNEVFDQSIKTVKLKIYNEYESIIKLMKQEKLDGKMIQIIIGPVYDISQRDIERLLRFGLIKVDENSNYKAFSKYFNEYLAVKSKEIDIWPIWSEVETEIRNLIKKQLIDKYGSEWEEGYRKEFKNKNGECVILDGSPKSLGLIKERDRSRRLFGDLASNHLIDYTLPRQMFDNFISKDWNWYVKVFGGQKGDWSPIFQHLAKIRNPIAHNNPDFLSSSDKFLSEGYCSKIIDKIKEWKIRNV